MSWWAGACQCSVCAHRHIAVIEGDPRSPEGPALECPACHHMTSHPVDDDEEEDGDPCL